MKQIMLAKPLLLGRCAEEVKKMVEGRSCTKNNSEKKTIRKYYFVFVLSQGMNTLYAEGGGSKNDKILST